MYKEAESLCYIPETNATLCVIYTQITKIEKKKLPVRWFKTREI